MAATAFRIRLLAAACTLVLAAALLELASWVLFRVVEGERFSFERNRDRREEVVSDWSRMSTPPEVPPGRPFPVDPDGVEGRPEKSGAETVPHPFLGYTANPEGLGVQAAIERGGMLVSEHGFLVLPKPPGPGPVWTVAVFGGSVAAYLSVDGRQALAETLERSPLARGRRVRVRSFAAPGYKQPQMAVALAYLLSLGEHFDALVELDGVNDVGVAYVEHRGRGKFPFYPREWEHLIADVGDPREQLRIGTIAYLHSRRAGLARAFSRRPLRWSVTAALVWRRIDRSLAARLAQAREAAVLQRSTQLTYRERGPVRVYADDDALMRDFARVWARSSLQMRALCAGAGIRYYHFLQPNQYVPNSKPMGEEEKRLAYRMDHPFGAHIVRGYPYLQAEGRALAAAGVSFTDLTPIFAGTTEPLYVDDCCHLNRRGSEMMARAIGARMAADR
ncbi:MAG: hypothetical protein ABW221_00220 [Vicinamibacteria bacterium]